MDRNQLTGLLLIFAILLGYYIFFNEFAPSAPPDERGTEEVMDSIAVEPTPDAVPPATATTEPDSAETARRYGSFAAAARGEARDLAFENEDLRIRFSTRGGGVSAVELKHFKTYEGQPLLLLNADDQQRRLLLPTATGSVDLATLFFEADGPAEAVVAAGDTQRVTFRLRTAGGTVEQTYLIPGAGYQVGYRLSVVGFDAPAGEGLRYEWSDQLPNVEKDIKQSRTMAGLTYYLADGDFEELTGHSEELEEETVSAPLRWFAFKNKFFVSALIADSAAFAGGRLTSVVPASDDVVKSVSASVVVPLAAVQQEGGAAFRFYFGPNDYRVLKQVTEGFEDNLSLGWLLFAWINKYLIINIFELLEGVISNYGVVIILVVLIIKLFLFPLSYRSYLSFAKTKALKPELDELKAQYGDDMQKMQQEQMKLYQQVGINPVAGCIPLLLQMPFLLAMFYFFPNAIHLRQEPFLWAEDLSTYDSIFNLPFVVPFGYGAHVSLFTLLMTASQIAYTYYNNQTTTTMQGPMQSVTYFMPLIFMFVLNSYPAGLSFYYFVSNIITVGQQLAIRRFVDEDQIRAKLVANKEKRKDKKQSKFQERMAAAMKASEEQKKRQQARKR